MFSIHKPLIVVITLFSMIGCSKPEPINMALHDWLGYQFPLIAQQDNSAKFEQFKVIKTKNATETINKLKNQEVLAGYLTLDEVLLARDQGISLSVVLVANISAGADVVISKEEINGAQDIRGKTIAYESTAVGNLVMQHFLAKYQLAQDDVILFDSPYNTNQFTFNKSALDFVVTYYPEASEILKTGATTVFTSKEMPNTIIDVLAVNNDFFEHNKSQICNVVNAHFYGVNQYYAHPKDIEYRLASLLKINHRTLLDSSAKISIPNLLINKDMLTAKNSMPSIVKKLHQSMVNDGMIKSKNHLNDIINNQCLNELPNTPYENS